MRNLALRVIFALAISSAVVGFGTINEPSTIGQHCEHERITKAAFACPRGVAISDGSCFEELSLHQLAGRSEDFVGQGSNGAVGAPDMLDPVPEGPEAHCDNADFFDSVSYPRTRAQATAQLQACVNHLRLRFEEGIDASEKIVDKDARIVAPEVDLSTLDCRFSFPMLQMHMFSRSKCSAIEGFGRALHGIQDFYAHSNWADDAKPPFSLVNPPGLKREDYPAFLDLRGENNISDQVPHALSTGCFGGILTDGPIGKAGHPLEPGSLDCTGRVTHHTLNKDNGLINELTGATSSPGPHTPRSDFPGNFDRAVRAAIRDSRRQWRHFREEIRRTYGTERGNIMICALVRDNPTSDCYGRRVTILRDGREGANRAAEMQIPVHKWLLEELRGKAHDEGPGEGVTPQNSTKEKGSSDELRKQFSGGSEKDHDQSGNVPFISSDLDLASALIDLQSTTTLPANKTAVLALTSTRNSLLGDQLGHIWHAGDKGIRVHLGLLSPVSSTSGDTERDKEQSASDHRVEQDLMTAVLRTGGTYSVLHSHEAIPQFISHVVSRGLTSYDNARDTATLLLAGLSLREYVTPAEEPRRFSFDAHTTDNVVVSVAPLTPRLSLHVCVRHVRSNEVIKELDIGLEGNTTFRAELGIDDIPRTDAWFELEVGHIEGDALAGQGLFEVSILTESSNSFEPLSTSTTRSSSSKDHHLHDEL